MTSKSRTRQTKPEDLEQVLGLYPQAFPKEDLSAVVSALLGHGSKVLSMGIFEAEELVAHILFSICKTEAQGDTGALLAPLGVLPSHQRQGLGGALVWSGLDTLAQMGVSQVFVLGGPAYYQRFGFMPEKQVLTPYPLPAEYGDAWQSLSLADRSPLAAGPLQLPKPWMNPALW